MEKNIIIHHSKDMDGLVSGAIFNSFVNFEKGLNIPNSDLDIIGYDYGQEIPSILNEIENSGVFITDVSFDKNLYISLLERNNSLMIFDHHISFYNNIKDIFVGDNASIFEKTFNVFGKKIECEILILEKNAGELFGPSISFIYSKDNSSSLISFAFLYNFLEENYKEDFEPLYKKMEIFSELVFRVDNYDLFKTFDPNNPESFKKDLEFDLGLKGITGWDIEKIDIFSDDNISFIENIKKYGEIANHYISVSNKKSCQSLGFERIPETGILSNKRIFCVNIFNVNMTAAESVFHKNYDIFLFFAFDGNKFNCSIRTMREDINCNDIAKYFGGGGHKKASGFSVKEFESIFK